MGKETNKKERKRSDDKRVEKKMETKERRRGTRPRFFEARVSLGAVRESVVSPPMFYFILSAP